jgi:hypothetical protein
MNYIVTQREVLITRYLVTDVEDEDDAADCVRSGIEEQVEQLDTDTEPMPVGETDWDFEVAPE